LLVQVVQVVVATVVMQATPRTVRQTQAVAVEAYIARILLEMVVLA
jgi:hypothetical protein